LPRAPPDICAVRWSELRTTLFISCKSITTPSHSARPAQSCPPPRTRGSLRKEVFGRIRDYVIAHLDESIEVTALASIAGRSPFHFSRVFTRSVGVTPHRYVVLLRLQRATELIRHGRSGLAEIAALHGLCRSEPLGPVGPARSRRVAHPTSVLAGIRRISFI
jgi:transcriptional regulator GlxA family with amidase domain